MALIPLYFQIEKKLREKISESEIVTANGTLPSEEQLCKLFGVSRITIRKALSELVLDGLIMRKAGKGTFVLPKKADSFSVQLMGNFDELVSRGTQSKMKLLSEKLIDAPPEIRDKLRLGNETKVYYYEGLRQIGKNPYSFFNIYVPLHIGKCFTRSDLKSTRTFFNLIEDKTGTQIIEADQVITVSIVSKIVSEHLKMKIGEPILSAERIYFSEERMPVEIAISYYRSELYQYKVKLIRRIFMK